MSSNFRVRYICLNNINLSEWNRDFNKRNCFENLVKFRKCKISAWTKNTCSIVLNLLAKMHTKRKCIALLKNHTHDVSNFYLPKLISITLLGSSNIPFVFGINTSSIPNANPVKSYIISERKCNIWVSINLQSRKSQIGSWSVLLIKQITIIKSSSFNLFNWHTSLSAINYLSGNLVHWSFSLLDFPRKNFQ